MYTEVTGGRRGHTARLVSSPMKAPSGSCSLRLWYHMKGYGIQDLNIWYRTVNGGTLYKVKTLSGNSGDVWLKLVTTITLTDPNVAFEVVLEGR